jgi:HK97 family phage major capsid protein
MRQHRAELRAQAEKILDHAVHSKKDLEGDQLLTYNAILDNMKMLTTQIENHEMGRPVSDPTGRFTTQYPRFKNFGSGAAPANSGSGSQGVKSRLREVYNSASSATREQIDNFAHYIVTGDIQALADLRPGNDGASIIPTEIVPALERDYTAFAPVVSVARIWGTDTGSDAVFPVLSDSESAVQIAAASATGADDIVSGDTPPTELTGPTLHAWKVSSKPVFVPRETFTDSPIDIVSEVVGALLARIIRFENLKYTKGAGTIEAEGFLTNATKLVTGAVALDLDICLDLAYNVPQLYRPNGVYMLSDTTAKYLRKLKTGLSGDRRQLWADADATKGTPATLHGYPVIINNDMDSVAADGTFTGNPISFGDMSKFVVRQAENNQPYAYRYQVPAKDGAAVILFRRSDSKLLVTEAISKVAVS